MPSDVGSILLSAVIGGMVTLIVAYILYRFQRERRVITYGITSVPLLQFHPTPTHALSVKVHKFARTHSEADTGVYEDVKSAYAFLITARNVGNKTADKPVLTITLDSSANIVEYKTKPKQTDEYAIKLAVEREKPDDQEADKGFNTLRVTLPYLNTDDEVVIYVMSTDNTSERCDVAISGYGIRGQAAGDRDSSAGPIVSVTVLGATLIVLLISTFLLSHVQPHSTAFSLLVIASLALAPVGVAVGLIYPVLSLRRESYSRKRTERTKGEWL